MSGLPPPGTGHVAVTLSVAASMTLTLPGPCDVPNTDELPRFETKRLVPSRLGVMPWAPTPVGTNFVTASWFPSRTNTPPAIMSAT